MLHEAVLSSKELFGSTVVFSLFSVILLYPPQAFISTGLTLEAIFASFVGDPQYSIVDFQMRRIVVNRAFIGCIPFLYSLFLHFYFENYVIFTLFPTQRIHYVALTTVALLVASVLFVVFHHLTKYEYLHLTRTLKLYSTNLVSLKRQIAAEYREFENFVSQLSYSNRFVVSNSWVFNSTKYDFTLVNLSDVTFEAVGTRDQPIDESGIPTQYVTIHAKVNRPPIKDFVIVVKSTSFNDLRDKLANRLSVTRELILMQSLSERFVSALIDQIKLNPTFKYPDVENLDGCLGCSSEQPNVKIFKSCELDTCRQCYCRPMWCAACMARIFAAKQDQQRPETWMSGKADCPTCRSTFCTLDVCFVADAKVEAEEAEE